MFLGSFHDDGWKFWYLFYRLEILPWNLCWAWPPVEQENGSRKSWGHWEHWTTLWTQVSQASAPSSSQCRDLIKFVFIHAHIVLFHVSLTLRWWFFFQICTVMFYIYTWMNEFLFLVHYKEIIWIWNGFNISILHIEYSKVGCWFVVNLSVCSCIEALGDDTTLVTDSMLENMKKIDRCLRVLENVRYLTYKGV